MSDNIVIIQDDDDNTVSVYEGVAPNGVIAHIHDDRYYTENETDTLIATKANTSHSHVIADTTGLQIALDDKQPIGNYSTVSELELKANELGLPSVYYGNDPETTRPDTLRPVTWVGYAGVAPKNAIANFDLVHSYPVSKAPDIDWKVLFDASNIQSISDGGLVSEWEDTIGGYDASQTVGSMKPIWRAQDSAFNNNAVVDFSSNLQTHLKTSDWGTYSQPNTIVLVSSSPVGAAGESKIIVDGIATDKRHTIGRWGSASYGLYSGTTVSASIGVDSGVHITIAEFNGSNSRLIVDGNVMTLNGNPGSMGLSGLTIGARVANYANGFGGKIAYLGVAQGLLTDSQKNELTRWGVSRFIPKHTIVTSSLSSLDTYGTVLKEKDQYTQREPASTLKTMTAYTARKIVADNALNDTVQVQSSDLVGGSTAGLQAGDIISYRDLMYGMLLPSGNDAANCLARSCGQILLNSEGGVGNPLDRFMQEMRSQATLLGWQGFVFADPAGGSGQNRLSAKQLSDLMRVICNTDQWLTEVMGTLTHSITIAGSNARLITVKHTINPDGLIKFPEFIAGKTGTTSSASVVCAWQSPSGEKYVTTILGSDEANRYKDLRAAIDSVLNARSLDMKSLTNLDLKTDKTYTDTQLSIKVDKVTGKQLSTEDYTAAEKTKLAGVETGAQVNVTPTKATVGLGNVSNLAPADMPVSTAQAASISTKVSLTGSETVAGIKTFSSALENSATNGVAYRQTRGGKNIGSGVSGAGNFAVYNFTASAEMLNVFAGGTGLALGDSGNAPRIIHGTGQPESVATAPVGSIYLDKGATNGITSWYKLTGIGNTGWRPSTLTSTAPVAATSAGVAGQIAYDANYMYICVATNTWKRSALASW